MASIETRKHTTMPDTFRVIWRANGTKHYSPTFDTRKEAEDFITLLQAEQVRTGFLPDLTRPRTPFSVVADQWRQRRLNSVSKAQVAKERAAIKVVSRTFGDQAIGGITRHQIQAWVNDITTDPAEGCEDCEYTQQVAGDDDARCRHHKGVKVLAPSSLATYYTVFGQIMREAQLDGYLPNGCPIGKGIIKLPTAYGREIFLTDDQVDHLLEVAVDHCPEHAAQVHTLAHTGMRIGESMAVRRDEYNPLAKRLYVVRSGSRQTTKNERRRRIDLDACCVEIINAQLAGHDFNLLFPSPRGRQQNVTNWRRRVWYPLREAAGFAELGLHPHDLRHSHATSLLTNGWPVEYVAERLGHASTKMTHDRYGHAVQGEQARLIRERGIRARVAPER